MFIVHYRSHVDEFFAKGDTIQNCVDEIENMTGDIFDNNNACWYRCELVKVIQTVEYKLV